MDSAFGEPLMVPVEESIERPLGKFGEMDQVTTEPPSEVGVTSVMVVPLV